MPQNLVADLQSFNLEEIFLEFWGSLILSLALCRNENHHFTPVVDYK